MKDASRRGFLGMVSGLFAMIPFVGKAGAKETVITPNKTWAAYSHEVHVGKYTSPNHFWVTLEPCFNDHLLWKMKGMFMGGTITFEFGPSGITTDQIVDLLDAMECETSVSMRLLQHGKGSGLIIGEMGGRFEKGGSRMKTLLINAINTGVSHGCFSSWLD